MLKSRWRTVKRLMAVTLVLLLTFNPLWSPAAFAARKQRSNKAAPSSKLAGKVAEAAPPPVIQELSTDLDDYQPQVTIVSPSANQVLDDTTVAVKLQVKDLPIFKDKSLELGPHIHVFLDNRPYQAVYDLSQPLVFEDLQPGTHTIRAFASRPWHESFKNEGAYAQTTFHVFTKTQENSPDPNQPLLTYSRPQGSYGAEPIMLDFYLTNAPLHLVAQESQEDDIPDWRIRVTVNGESFVVDRWQPIYLKGFQPGKNWVQLEYLDEQGNPVPNVFNNTARVITYEPCGKDTLSRLVRGDLTSTAARGIVDPNYTPAPEPTPEPAPEPSPAIEPTPEPSPAPSVVPIPAPAISPAPDVMVMPTPPVVEPSVVEPSPTPEAPQFEPSPTPPAQSVPEIEAPSEAPTPVPVQPGPKKPGFFNRFRPAKPSPAPFVPEPIAPEPAVSPSPEVPESPGSITPAEPPSEPQPELAEPSSETTPETGPTIAPPVTEPKPVTPTKPGFFNRFRPDKRPTVPLPSPTPVPTLLPSEPSETVEPAVKPIEPAAKLTPEPGPAQPTAEPFPAPSPALSPTQAIDQPERTPVPTELSAPAVETAPIAPLPTAAPAVQPSPTQKPGLSLPNQQDLRKLFSRFRGPTPQPPEPVPESTGDPIDVSPESPIELPQSPPSERSEPIAAPEPVKSA